MKRHCFIAVVSALAGCGAWAQVPSSAGNLQACQQAIDKHALARQNDSQARIAEAEKQVRQDCFPVEERAPVLQAPITIGPAPKAQNPPNRLFPSPPGAKAVPVPELSIPAAPGVLTTCDPGGCWDNHGNRYNGSGALLFGDGGQPCLRNGDRIECR